MLATQLSRDEIQILRRLPFFAVLSDAELTEIAGSVRRRGYRRGEVIHHVDDVAGDVFVVTHGVVKHRLTAFDGRQITHAITGPGISFGIMSVIDNKRRAGDAVALTDCELMVLDREIIVAFRKRHPEVDTILLDLHVGSLRGTLDLIHDLAFLSVPMRLAKALLRFSEVDPDSVSGQAAVPAYLNQTELAFLVGTTRESINQGLKHFARQGWIAFDRRRVLVVDPEALRRSINVG